ncbi:c-type cytochrome [Blastopirellula sp. JC732]|uniref:C-type cytochrome n=1 Tax=Blastopirellula sediminis TaxID=2894196 RepID=A0A9X1SG73_9BACT|nr:PVC-type heme-binding CxxCH protein [Blastopirellula sediminis]MCC9608847.1 c-type cytochrome [Blastopirellula sediminis]MCC9628376.1 c-type cytochrome [Blastopirellula sediminis]
MPKLHAPTLGAWLLFISACACAEDPFQSNVRPTDPLTAEEERATFTAPSGFRVELFAAEPQIAKPLNMAFDARGRLWVTETREYPYPAPLDKPARDAIKILEDTDGDGRADKITQFADGLNIPIGLYPFAGGCIVYSIPNIYLLQDLDGDDVADQRTVLYGPMGYERDTHGMNNSFRRGFDGWLYACHGFSNVTRVAGKDGHQIEMTSGNTYRMRLDGERVEHFTHGQVNPFGMTTDPQGNLFTADCHSKPIYQLLRGGFYPSFGRPDDGLGFVPPMMSHLHGSTAIAGVVRYDDNRFPAEYREDFFSGNVMTSRVNRNRAEYHGSTILAVACDDFVSTTDPWFRPVDVQLGPDGALYVADFYNKIIGHYEVPLEHPGRDRERGRIWRITYDGDGADRPHQKTPNLATADVATLINSLADVNLTTRLLATHEIVDRYGAAATEQLRAALKSASPTTRAHAAWCLARIGDIRASDLQQLAGDPDKLVRIHAMRILSELPNAAWNDETRTLAIAGTKDEDAFVARAAADALGMHPQLENVRPLIRLWQLTHHDDNHLVMTARIALREHFRDPATAPQLIAADFDKAETLMLAEIAIAARSPQGAEFLLTHWPTLRGEGELAKQALENAAQYSSPESITKLGEVVTSDLPSDLATQLRVLLPLAQGAAARGQLAAGLAAAANRLLGGMEAEIDENSAAWQYENIADPDAAPTWNFEPRKDEAGQTHRMLSSLPGGEKRTSRLISPEFTLPAKLTFRVAGHNRFPNTPAQGENFVQLRLANGDVVAKVDAPRTDVATRVEWDLSDYAGEQGRLEVVDQDHGNAYAWIAIGDLPTETISLPQVSPAERFVAQAAFVQLAAALGEKGDQTATVRLLQRTAEPQLRRPLAIELTRRGDAAIYRPLAERLGTGLWPQRIDDLVVEIACDAKEADPQEVYRQSANYFDFAGSRKLADELASTVVGARILTQLIDEGKLPTALLADAALREKLLLHADDALRKMVEKQSDAAGAADSARIEMLAQRIAQFKQTPGDVTKGAAMFKKHCAACHQVAGEGAIVGPQLDGIGNRGAERVLEDVLLPNRNVDQAFRTSILRLVSGEVITGLVRNENDESLTIVDQRGNARTIAADDVEERRASRLSLMPENVADALSESEFYDLASFLSSQRSEVKKEE